MHIHGNQMDMNSASLYSAAGAEKAAATQKAADVRRKLMKSATDIEGISSPDEAYLVSKWMDPLQSQEHGGQAHEDKYRSSTPDEDFELS